MYEKVISVLILVLVGATIVAHINLPRAKSVSVQSVMVTENGEAKPAKFTLYLTDEHKELVGDIDKLKAQLESYFIKADSDSTHMLSCREAEMLLNSYLTNYLYRGLWEDTNAVGINPVVVCGQ